MKKPKGAGGDDKKLQTALKKLAVQPITGIEEVNMFKEDGNVLHFSAPKGKRAFELLVQGDGAKLARAKDSGAVHYGRQPAVRVEHQTRGCEGYALGSLVDVELSS